MEDEGDGDDGAGLGRRRRRCGKDEKFGSLKSIQYIILFENPPRLQFKPLVKYIRRQLDRELGFILGRIWTAQQEGGCVCSCEVKPVEPRNHPDGPGHLTYSA